MPYTSIIVDTEQSVSIIYCDEDLDNENAPSLLDLIEEQLKQEQNKIILDFSKMRFISSVGIGVLAFSCKEVAESNGQLALVSSDPKILSFIKLSQLEDSIEIYTSLDEALTRWNASLSN